jgi:outer membrane lipoprotein-sorting protein
MMTCRKNRQRLRRIDRTAELILFCLFGILLFPSLLAPAAFAQEQLTATEIVRRADQLLRGKTSVGKYEMTIITPNWERTLAMDVWTEGYEKTFIRITAPPKEAGVGSLRIETNMWNYLPKVERIIKIPPSMMMQSWMGSDFTNDDLVKESSVVKDYTHELMGTETVDGFETWKIALTPKPEAPVVWGKIIMNVRKSDFNPVREEFYSESGKLVRVMTFSDFRKMDDRTIPTKWVMQPVDEPDKRTVLLVEEIHFNVAIPASVFTLQNLKRVQ